LDVADLNEGEEEVQMLELYENDPAKVDSATVLASFKELQPTVYFKDIFKSQNTTLEALSNEKPAKEVTTEVLQANSEESINFEIQIRLKL